MCASLARLSSCSTIGKGGDATIPSPRRSSKQPLPGIGLHDLLHGRQACSESNSFHQGVGHICPRQGLFSCRSLSKRGQICYIPSPSQSLNGSILNRVKHDCIVKGDSGCATPTDLGLVVNQQSQHYLKGESFLDFDMRMGNIGGEI